MSELTYRNGTMSDIVKLKLLGLNSYGKYKDHLSDDNWNKLETYLLNKNTYVDLLSKSRCFVCEIDNHIVGMAFLVSSGNPTDIFQEEWAYLRMIGVHTKFAGKGIGKKLTRMCIDYARMMNEKTLALHTSEFMDAARHIYEAAGFYQYKELEPRLGKRYWLYLLEFDI